MVTDGVAMEPIGLTVYIRRFGNTSMVICRLEWSCIICVKTSVATTLAI